MMTALRPALAGVLLLANAPFFLANSDTLPQATTLDRRGSSQVQRLVEEIERAKPQEKKRLFGQLTGLKSRESLEAMQRITNSLQNADVLRSAFLALENYRGVEGVEAHAVDYLAEECGASRQPVRRAAAKALSHFDDAAAPELSRLVKRSKDEVVRAWCLGPLLQSLQAQGTPGALKTILENARLEKTAAQAELVTTFSSFTGEANENAFFGAMRNKKIPSEIKVTVVEAIGTRKSPGVEKALLGALKDKSPALVLAAISALDARDTHSHAATLKKLQKSADEGVRRQAIISLGQLRGGDEAWASELAALAKDKDPAVRMGAAVALAELRTPEALAELYLLLSDPDHLVQRETLQQLGNLRRKDAIPALIARINGARGLVRRQLLWTLRMITAEDHGASNERWKRWWQNEGEAFEVPEYTVALREERERELRRASSETTSTFFGLQVVSDRICFIMDISGSMEQRSGDGNRLDAAKEQLLGVLEKYPEGDLFNVIFFSSDAFAWSDELVKMTKKSRKEALSYVTRQTPGGATAIYDALKLAFEDRRIDTIYLLTDGDPMGGTIDAPGRIRTEVERWNQTRKIQIHCIAVGKPSELLKDLARDSGGEYHEEN
jgi:HEAT repeat protein